MTQQPAAQPINQFFAAVVDPPAAKELDAFVVFCLERVQHLWETQAAKDAFQQFKASGTVEPAIAEEANIQSNSLSQQHFNAAKAIAHAVCHCVPPDTTHHCEDRTDNARLVALYCQWAISHAEYPADPDEEFDCDEETTDDPSGRLWLMRQIEQQEQAAQLQYLNDHCSHWTEAGT